MRQRFVSGIILELIFVILILSMLSHKPSLCTDRLLKSFECCSVVVWHLQVGRLLSITAVPAFAESFHATLAEPHSLSMRD